MWVALSNLPASNSSLMPAKRWRVTSSIDAPVWSRIGAASCSSNLPSTSPGHNFPSLFKSMASNCALTSFSHAFPGLHWLRLRTSDKDGQRGSASCWADGSSSLGSPSSAVVSTSSPGFASYFSVAASHACSLSSRCSFACSSFPPDTGGTACNITPPSTGVATSASQASVPLHATPPREAAKQGIAKSNSTAKRMDRIIPMSVGVFTPRRQPSARTAEP
mmetsp:Transcript_90097/g.280478  ORF Transcript_90097/g.280478 Transcript_90097/m.280478 type:complete len:220 (-) Transcript_90097:10-669(-)